MTDTQNHDGASEPVVSLMEPTRNNNLRSIEGSASYRCDLLFTTSLGEQPVRFKGSDGGTRPKRFSRAAACIVTSVYWVH